MQNIKILFTLLLLISCIFADPFDNTDNQRPKIGLVLSGGGALGFAHIGTLQVIDSLNIHIDYIAGTSMGGIASGLYALGNSGKEIEQISQTIDWTEIFTDMPERDLQSYLQKKDDGKYQFSFGFSKGNITVPSGLIYGQTISMLLSNLTYQFEHIENFDDLPIPFRCVAVDLITGNEVILKNGSISKALRSTMSIPSVFNPVQWGDSLLIDGGLLNNLPVDVVKEMGADIVIAVNVSQSYKETSDLNSALKILDRTIAIPAATRSRENIKDADVYIEPELTNLLRTDFRSKAINAIIAQGKIAAIKAIPQLIEMLIEHKVPIKNAHLNDNRLISNIYIGGNRELTSEYISELLNINVGEKFNIDTLKSRISILKLNQPIDDIEYDLLPIDDNNIDILLQVRENIKPTIHRISIRGNKSIPFSFIYRLLGINPTDTLDINIINQRIDELYGLGYFETISYEIEPINDNSVHLIFAIKEASRSLLRLGFYYDETNKFIGAVNLVSTKVLIPGLRFESTLRFSGLFDFRAKLFYPIRLSGLSIYPFVQTYHKKHPVDIYGNNGNRIAEYFNQSASWSTGLGFLSVDNWSTEIEYNSEFIDIKPNIAILDTTLFSSWDDELRKINVSTTLDKLDDVIIPTKGILLNATYENSLDLLKTDVPYDKFVLNVDFYKTLGIRHTFRLFTQFGYSNNDLPLYKWFSYGGPNRFIGIEKNELSNHRTSIFGVDYRIKFTDKIYIKTMFNIAPNYNGDFYPIESNAIMGYGVGIKYLTYLGPIELIYSRGDKITKSPSSEQRNMLYLNFGYNL